MIFRRKSNKAVSVNPPEVASYALIPVYHGKNRGTFGNQIIKIIEESSFCSTSPLVKRLIVKNVKVWCIVIETSGSRSLRIICASVPYMLSLIARTSTRFKSLLEDERVVSHLKFFQETDFETLLGAVCSATIIIHKGVKKCYPIISVHLGHEALVFTQSSLFHLKNLLFQSLVSAFHFFCEDMPNILQSLCSQNYAVAKYFVQNLPVIALGGAKHFLLLTLYIQRLVAASLKTAKKCVKFFRRTFLNVCSRVDFVQLMKIMYGYFMSVVTFIVSHYTFKSVQSALIGSYPILQKYIPLAWSHIWNFIEKCVPIFKAFINRFVTSLPKILKFMDDNKPNAIRLFCLAKQCVKDLLWEIKPLCEKLFKVIRLSSENVLKLCCFLMPRIEFAASEMIRNLKRFILSETTRKIFRGVFLSVKELWPIAVGFYLKVCDAVIIFCKYLLKNVKEFFSSFSVREKARKSYSLINDMNSFLQPVVSVINSTCFDCAEEVLSKSCLVAHTVAPSLWCGWKAVTCVTIRASYEIYATAKSSTLILYPDLLKSVVVVFPELKRGLAVVLDDSKYACTEVATVSYLASQELLLAVKCVSLQLPFVFKALSQVSVTSSGAVTEIFLTSSKARIRVKNDLDTAIQEVSLAIHLVQLEILNVVCEMDSAFSDKGVREMLALLSGTNNLVFTYVCKEYLLAIRDFSALSYNAAQHISTKIMCALQWIAKCVKTRTTSIQVSSKNHFIAMCDTLQNFFVDLFLLFSDFAVHNSKQMFLAVVNEMSVIIPILWQQSKMTNAIIWRQFCKSSSQLWALLELEAAAAFQLICLYTPELWDFLKRSSYQTWQLTRDMSPALWDVALPLFPVVWASNCNAIQCVWEFHVKTCSCTWKVIVPVSSSSWKYLLKSCPKAWEKFCSNSKYQWVSFCNSVEFSWSAMTVSSALSWKMLHKTVSTSWRNVLGPVTTSACGRASSAVAKTLKLSNSVCSKSKEFLLMYKTSFYDFSDIKLE